MNGIRLDLADLNEVFHFCNGDPAGSGHDGIKIPGCLAINEITPPVALPRFDECEICLQSLLEDIHPAVVFASFLAFSDDGAVAGGCKECGDTRSARSYSFGKGSLGN